MIQTGGFEMTFKELKFKIKEEQKTLAQEIRVAKPLRKPKNWTDSSEEQKRCSRNEVWNQSEYRHIHIVYCNFFNGTPYEKIEQPRHGNKPSSHKLDNLRKTWEAEIDDEALRNCA